MKITEGLRTLERRARTNTVEYYPGRGKYHRTIYHELNTDRWFNDRRKRKKDRRK